ncbi:MAG: polysaccharide deacetylase family protein [Kofleriaceae bacterium]
MAAPPARAAVSIDVDGVGCYYRIHGLGPPPPAHAETIAARCVPRFLDLFARRGLPATFFVVGADAEAEASRAVFAAAHQAGHELGNHSHTHPYDLARAGAAVVADEIGRADAALRAITGAAVAGFRAPGYDLSPTMLAELVRRGYRYDSSIFPAPGYYAAKAAVMGALAVVGRPSGAVLTEPRALAAPIDPYRPATGAPWRRGDAPLVELPIAVTRGLRLPAIGTSLLLAPPWLARRLVEAMAPRPLFNFELHGIDLADAQADGLPPALIARQPDLRVPLSTKLARLERVLDLIQARFEVATLGACAAAA